MKKTIKIPVGGARGRGKFALIDAEDHALVSAYNWYVDRNGYASARGPKSRHWKERKWVTMSRLVMRAPRNLLVDHKNADRLDNRRANLRFCTQGQNRANARKNRASPGPQPSRFKGVCAYRWKETLMWTAHAGDDYLGLFREETEAARAYDRAAIKKFGAFARTNEDLGLY